MKATNYFLVFILILFTISSKLYSQKNYFNSDTEITISLLTYSPGGKLYSAFGHSALRIIDRKNHSDIVYNYGTFHFDQPNFYLRFLQGNLIYSLSVATFENVKQSLILENRSLVETPLNLNNEETSRLINYLKINMLPDNRNYRYDFLFDNCSTRILELLEKNTADSLIIKPEVLPVKSFRQLIRPYLKNRPWINMGIDLLMGTQADKTARMTEPAFLPDFLHLFIKNFQLEKKGSLHRLANHDIIHLQNYQIQSANKLTPSLIFWPIAILFLISALFDSYFRPFFQQCGNIILFLIGLISLLLCFLWIFSDHSIFRNNIDLLWANPLLLLVVFLQIPKFHNRYNNLKKIFLVFTGIIVGTGILTSLIIEKNFELTSLGITVLILCVEKTKYFSNSSRSINKSRF